MDEKLREAWLRLDALICPMLAAEREAEIFASAAVREGGSAYDWFMAVRAQVGREFWEARAQLAVLVELTEARHG